MLLWLIWGVLFPIHVMAETRSSFVPTPKVKPNSINSAFIPIPQHKPILSSKQRKAFDIQKNKEDVIDTILGEARSEKDEKGSSYEAMQAVANVIDNRKKRDEESIKNVKKYKTFSDVVKAENQFDFWGNKSKDGEANRKSVFEIDKKSKEYEDAVKITDLLFAGKLKDVTKGSDHFFRQNKKTNPPPWAYKMSEQRKLLRHRFFDSRSASWTVPEEKEIAFVTPKKETPTPVVKKETPAPVVKESKVSIDQAMKMSIPDYKYMLDIVSVPKREIFADMVKGILEHYINGFNDPKIIMKARNEILETLLEKPTPFENRHLKTGEPVFPKNKMEGGFVSA